MSEKIREILQQANVDKLQEFVKKTEGLRHGWENYHALEGTAKYIEMAFRSFGLDVESQKLSFCNKTFRNIIATKRSLDSTDPWILIGAHYDAAWGSPGADDNASGVGVMLETARLLSNQQLNITLQFAAFTLEEPQPQTIHFLIGSDFFASEARKSNRKYMAVLILESVGYTDHSEGSQITPLFVKIPVPKTGNFLGVIANRRSRDIMHLFQKTAGEYTPELPVVSYKVPLSGRIIPETRFSDHASFWNYGYPALMLTDTAMFRNPHYHTYHDKFETLDFNFMLNVTRSVVSVILKICDEK